MNFTKLSISGAYLVKSQKREDTRGSLVRIWDDAVFVAEGITTKLKQGYISETKKKGTMRGLHAQVAPSAEDKLTKVLRGKIFEVIVDIRKESPTYLKWEGVALGESDNTMMFIPSGVAHGFLTLSDDVLFKNMSSFPFTPEHEIGIRFDDPAFSITWPIPVVHISEKDMTWKDFEK